MSFFSRLFFSSVCLLGLSCASTPEVWSPPRPEQVTRYLKNHALNPRERPLTTVLRGEFEIYRGSAAVTSLKGEAAVGLPRKMRLEVSGLFGQTTWMAVTDGQTVWVVDFKKRSCDALPLDSSRIQLPDSGLNIPLHWLVTLLSSFPQDIANLCARDWQLRSGKKEGEVVEWTSEPYTYTFGHPGSAFPEALTLTTHNQHYRQEYKAWREFDSGLHLASRWILHNDAQQGFRSWHWVWKGLSDSPLPDSALPFEKPDVSFCREGPGALN